MVGSSAIQPFNHSTIQLFNSSTMNRIFICLLLSLLMLSCVKDKKTEMLDQHLSEMFLADEPGAEVLVAIDGQVVFDKGYGLRLMSDSLSAADAQIDHQTFFNIASCSKQFTSVAVLQLVEQGKVQLDAPVRKYFPELTNSIWDGIEVRHLLSHSSGIPDARGYLSREQRVYGDEQLATEYLWTLDQLHFAPGTEYEYMNPTYVLLGMLVERVSGMCFTDYAEKNILVPAGMTETFYFTPDLDYSAPHLSHGYKYDEQDEVSDSKVKHEWYEYDYGEETFFATRADGGIYTSAQQLLLWDKALQRSLADDKDALVSAELLSDAMAPHQLCTGSIWSDYQNREDTWYGYGWFVEPKKGCVYHTGDNGGYKALIARYPKNKGLVIVLANRNDWDRYALKTFIEQLYGLTE